MPIQPLLSELKDRAGDMYKPSPVFEKIDQKNAKDPASKIGGMPPNYGEFLVPHVVSFVGVLSSMARVYRASDEAIKHSRENARFMRNDISVMESIEQRQRSCALLDWHIECDDDKDPTQKWLAGEMEDILGNTPKFMQYRENLLHALWYGKYGVQAKYAWKRTAKGMRLCVAGWVPVNGDKIVFRYDDGTHQYQEDRIGIRVGAGIFAGDKIAGAWAAERMKKVEATDYGLAYFLEPWERPLMAIHKHYIEDGEYEEPISAGKIHGVGIRSRIYWSWYQKQEALAWLMEFLERSAFGLELWYYPYGNSEAEAKARTAAQERIGGGRNIILVPRPVDDSGNMYGVEVIERNMAGAEVLKEILHSYFGHQIKRYILGQTLTTEADSTGLGSNLASIHLDTYLQIVRYDAMNLEETITEELLRPLLKFNFPKYAHLPLRFSIETESPDVQAKLEGCQKAWEMGAKLPAKAIMDLIGMDPPQPGEDVLQNTSVGGAGGFPQSGAISGGQQMPGAAPGTEEYGRAQVQGGLGLADELQAKMDAAPEPVAEQLGEKLGVEMSPIGDKEEISPIGDKPEYDPKEEEIGVQTEMEHTSDPAVSLKIAREHLAEDPHYYSKLVKAGLTEPAGDGGDRERVTESYAKFFESEHPRDESGEFAEKEGGGGNAVAETVSAVLAGKMSGTAAKKAMKATGLHEAYLEAMRKARAPKEPTEEERAAAAMARKQDSFAMKELIAEAKRGAPEELHRFIESAGEARIGDDSVTAEQLVQAANYERDEEREYQERLADEKEARDAAYAAWTAKREATAQAVRQVRDVFSAAGYSVEQTGASMTGSHYFDLSKSDEVITLRVSDHYAPSGSGWNEQTQEQHSTPDVNIVVEPGTDVDWKAAVSEANTIYEDRREQSNYARWSTADQLKYRLFGIDPKHVCEAFWAHGANGQVVQEQDGKVFKYTRVGGNVTCERYNHPFDESLHRRGQPENAGQFAEKKEQGDTQQKLPIDRAKARFRLSSIGPSQVPAQWGYGDADAEDTPTQSGFQVWDDLSSVIGAMAGDAEDGSYTPEDGYEHFMVVVPSRRKPYAGGNFWSSVQPKDVTDFRTVETDEMLAWLQDVSGAWDKREGWSYDRLYRYIDEHEDGVYQWLEENSKKVDPEIESTF